MFTLNCKGRLLAARQPLVMGIINITPDSFYAGSRKQQKDDVLRQTEQMLEEGADIIDLGAQSTRPGSEMLPAAEELDRIGEIMDTLSDRFREAVFSVDTFYSRVASACVSAGASIINDISGGQIDREMIPLAGSLGVPYICSHMRGTPATMQAHTDYDDVAAAVLDYFITKAEECRAAGIRDLIIDPGFGFSKTIGQNFELLHKLDLLKIVGRPILAGISRKSFIYKTLGTDSSQALNGTTVLNTVALLRGAGILRVHDVQQARECVQLVQALKNAV